MRPPTRLLVVCLVLLAGCGNPTGPAPKTPEDAMTMFLQAVARRDAKAACRLLTGQGQARMLTVAVQQTEKGGGSLSRCEDAVARVSEIPGWDALARGSVVASGGAGLDSVSVRITYELDGDFHTGGGFVDPRLVGGGYGVSSFPVPGH